MVYLSKKSIIYFDLLNNDGWRYLSCILHYLRDMYRSDFGRNLEGVDVWVANLRSCYKLLEQVGGVDC